MFGRLVTLLAALCALTSTALAQPYVVIDLKPLPGETSVSPTDLFMGGQVVGTSGNEVVVWDRPGDVPRPLGIRGDATSPSEIGV